MKKLFIGIDFSKEKLDATIILACGMNEIGSREYGCFPNNTTGYRKLCNWVKTLSLQLIDKRSEIYFKKVKRDE